MSDGTQKIEVTARLDPELSRSLDRLAAKVEEGTRQTVQEIHRMAQSAAKTELSKQRAELKAIGPIIKQQDRQIDVQSQKTFSLIAEAWAKFDKIARQLWESYVRDVRRLGAHIFEILEVEYGRGMENRIRQADFDVFTGITPRIYDNSSKDLASHLDRAMGAARNFVGMRQRFQAALKDCKLDTTVPRQSEFAVPVWLVEIEENGKVCWEVIGPSAVECDGQGEYRCTLRETEGYSEVSEMVLANLETVTPTLKWRDASPDEKGNIAKEIESLAGRGHVSKDLARIVARCLGEKELSIG